MIDFGNDPWLSKYTGMVIDISSRYASSGDCEWPDIVQAGISALYESKKTYCKSLGSFSNWAWYRIRKAVQTEANAHRTVGLAGLRDATYAKKKNVSVIPIDAESDTLCKTDTTTPYDIVAERDDEYHRQMIQSELWQKLNRRFSHRDRHIIIDYYANSVSATKCVRKYGTRVWRVIARAQMVAKGEEPHGKLQEAEDADLSKLRQLITRARGKK